MVRIEEITIGTDPEFVMVDTSKRPTSEDYVLYANQLGMLDRHRPFGSDGSLFEVRSEYSHNVLHVVDSIYHILKEAYDSIQGIRKYGWIAGHCFVPDLPTGGHIHIGLIDLPIREVDTFLEYIKRGLMDGLSNYIDPLRQRKVRERCGYGHPTSYRPQAYGNRDRNVTRIEYRAPGSFLVSPDITFLNLVIAKAITMLYFYNLEKLARLNRNMVSKNILVETGSLMETSIFIRENDIQLGRDILNKCINGKLNVQWDKDFKHTWGIV